MRKRLVPLLLVPLLALAACGDDDGDDGATTEDTASQGDAAREGSTGGVAVNAAGFRFAPSAIEATAGAPTTIDLTNEDDTDHTLTIEELGVDIAAGGGESASGDFTADAGEYDFVCRIHPSMTGTLTVT